MNVQLLKAVVDELAEVLPGARVDRVQKAPDDSILLALRKRREKYTLLLSPEPSRPRIHLVSTRPPQTNAPSSFIQFLKSRLAASRVKSVGIVNEDRVVEIVFARTGDEHHLIFEVFGSRPELVLTDGELKVLAAFRSGDLRGTARSHDSGELYTAPQRQPAGRGGLARGSAGAGLSGVFESALSRSPNRAVESWYEQQISTERLERSKQELSKALKKAQARTERRFQALSADLEKAEKADEYRQAGELILANLGRLERGMTSATLTGYDGHDMTVSLESALSPSRNADKYFRRFKKAKAGREIIELRLAEARKEASVLGSLRAALQQAGSVEDLHAVRESLQAMGSLSARGPKAERTVSTKAGPPYRRYVHAGWELLVGRSAAGNDLITTRLARPHDLWLHAEGMPGSHVLVRNPASREIPVEVIEQAASLAAYYSRGRQAGKVPVTYTEARFVKKPKRAKPGLVTVAKRRTIMAVPRDLSQHEA